MERTKAPVYVVKPKSIYRHPFNKYDLDKPTTRETQNEDLTDYFNYGFNEDTMNIYAKLIKRNIEALDENVNPHYFDAPSQLMRLNDEIPIDFGGFCRFFDTSIFNNEQNQGLQDMENFHNGQELFRFLICLVLKESLKHPLIGFVENLYRSEQNDDGIVDIMDEIEANIEKKYQETMRKLIEKRNQGVNPPKHEQKKFQKVKQQVKKRQERSSEQSSQEQSSSEQSERSRSRKKKKYKERKQKKRYRSRSREKRKRSRSRDKKKKKDYKYHKSGKDHRRNSRSRDRDRDRDRRSKRSKERRRSKDRKHYKRSP